MNCLLGSTSVPISSENVLSVSIASCIVSCCIFLIFGSIVVSHSCSAFISPSPLYLCIVAFSPISLSACFSCSSV